MDIRTNKKRKRGPYLRDTLDDEEELTLTIDSSLEYANLQESDSVSRHSDLQTTSISTSGQLRITVSMD
jgi:hypothetical protein